MSAWSAWRRRRLLARLKRQKDNERRRLRAALFGLGLAAALHPQDRRKA